jgi:hypothetical protein
MNHRCHRSSRCALAIAVVGCLAGLVAAGLVTTTPCRAASIPAWLDDAITAWNEKSPATPIEFLEIKDDYVWYTMPKTAEFGHKELRDSIYSLVLERGYKLTDDEERVTTGKPPSPVSPYKTKKCWTRSFVLDIEELSNTTAAGGRGGSGKTGLRQRMLTSLLCEDTPYWLTGFRILQ